MIRSLALRDVRAALGSGVELWAAPFFFLLLFTTLVLSFGSGLTVSELSGATWVALTIGAFLSLVDAFKDDRASGAIDYLRVASVTPTTISLSKWTYAFIAIVLPTSLVAGCAVAFMSENTDALPTAVLTLLTGGIGLAAYSTLCAALMASSGYGGLIGLLVTLPLLSPLFVFGSSSLESAVEGGEFLMAYMGLAGWSLSASVVGVVASAALIGVGGE